ncbi:MAG TPA: TonB-dependent receptor [Bacteroidales bacterium]|nr:MAG: hypothetical protein A2W98_05890 [Bacteroidetes bacterium GWF2_33_38]OFY74460.1 MAG: hypothetical protein A2265_08295 [Bacteroidetes bacterium RIFOXYA12_FULL_33_9]OFY92159.1 MAG: hypothetical protein A2236_07565 [Bacteroidetes bacterium RIFOXYA2_FULL_33_7]HBF88338.1 TonB-dependent receptor [Bacteroidales bacterium]
MKNILIIIGIFLTFSVNGQDYISGFVQENQAHGEHVHFAPLVNANVYWLNSTNGTITDENGYFTIEKIKGKNNFLVFSYMGYSSDTIEVGKSQKEINIVLKQDLLLNEVVVEERVKGEFVSKMKTIQTQTISTHGLQKMACCNLSESFENSATVDVSYSDAVTGAKQIQMLGLAGVYSQILTENVPMIRGVASTFGLGYIPGTWMESIQISKGTASVINGYESTTGQINIEYKKPDKADKFFVNLYANHMMKSEANVLLAKKITERLSTMLLTHAENFANKVDDNKDGFMDMPLIKQINLFNRWTYDIEGKFCGQYGVKYLYENRAGGQTSFYKDTDYGTTNSYGLGVNTQRIEVFAKNGIQFKGATHKSLGLILSGTYHKQNSFFGLNNYDVTQRSLYGNLIYQTIISNTNHKISTGLSYVLDNYTENFNLTNLDKIESVPGAFAQYTYEIRENMSLILGLRSDLNSKFGLFITPRTHFRWEFAHETILRASAGKGYRTANVFVENTAMLASSRQIVIIEDFDVEEAWNCGINLTKHLEKGHDELGTISIDFYRTDFVNQIIVDFDQDASKAYLYNLDGKSYSNSAQIELIMTPFKRFDFTLAARYNDVKATLNNELIDKPLVNKLKGVLALSYATNHEKWQFDITNQLVGTSRLPNTQSSPAEYQKAENSPAYYILHAQITKKYKNLDFYIGGENLTNFVQKDPIISPENPFGEHFDTSMIWGPIVGRMFYVGFRFNIK